MNNLKLLAICCLSVLLFGACDSGSSSNSSSLSKSEDLNYQKACEELDFGKAHQILKKLREAYLLGLKEKGLVDNLSEKSGYMEYVDADIYIFREELTYLMNLDDSNVENRIIKLIMETPLDGTPYDEGKARLISDIFMDNDDVMARLYLHCIKRNNQKCDIAMDMSILLGNQSLAKKVLMYYKDNMHIEMPYKAVVKGETIEIDGDHSYVWYDSSDKDAAQKRYDVAVKNGVFK